MPGDSPLYYVKIKATYIKKLLDRYDYPFLLGAYSLVHTPLLIIVNLLSLWSDWAFSQVIS